MDVRKMMGFTAPGDQKVPVPARDWNAMKLALWRSKVMCEIAERAAVEIIERCAHVKDCEGKVSESEPCRKDCPDREQRMSALVILNAVLGLAPVNARKPAEEFFYAPSREYFSEVISSLSAAQIENDMLHALLRQAGIQPPSAETPQPDAALPASTPAALPEETKRQ